MVTGESDVSCDARRPPDSDFWRRRIFRLEPAPITPTTPETLGWNVLAGSVKETYRTRIRNSEADALEGTEIVASPAIMSGNVSQMSVRSNRQTFADVLILAPLFP